MIKITKYNELDKVEKFQNWINKRYEDLDDAYFLIKAIEEKYNVESSICETCGRLFFPIIDCYSETICSYQCK